MSLKQMFVSTVLVGCLLAGSALAQVLYGTLTGNVTDPSGAAVAGAKVTVTNVNTGVTSEATVNDGGVYRFQALQAGTYKVSISAANFATQVSENVPVAANQVARVDGQLKLAQQKEAVTVTAEAPLLQTDKADVHTDLSTRQVEDLPTSGTQGRNFQALLRIIPGTSSTAETNSLAGNPQRAINTNVNGQSNQTNNTRIDGAQDWYAWLPANVAYVPPADAIETVNVTTNAFDAEQGTAGGASVNVQIKSGTNSFHGSGHEFYTSQLFAARPYFSADPNVTGNKNKNIQHQFGGTIGGPIVKNKLFFFGDYERTTQRQLAGPVTATLPTVNMTTGDFRGLTVSQQVGGVTQQVPVIIYDPRTGDATGAGKTQISCNGVLNVICPDRIDPAAAKMVQLLQPDLAKLAATGDNLNNFIGSGTALFNRDTADIKVNYVPNEKSTVFARYSFSKTLVFDPPFLGDAVGNATNGGQLGNAPGLIQSVGLGATYAFTPTLLLDWNFGFTRQRLGSTFDLSSAKGLNDLGIPGTNNAGAVGDPSLYYGLPGFIFPTNQTPSGTNNQVGTSLGNAQPANPFLFRDGSYVSGANLSWIKGKHALRGGFEWNHAQINHFQPQGGTFQNPRGVFEFNGYATSNKGGSLTPQWFNSWADFMLGLPSATGKAIQLFNPNALRWNQWAWYLRDQWQVTPRLTVNLGVRWEYYPFGYSDNGKGLRYFDLKTGNVLIGGNGNVPRNDGIDVGSGQFLPRVGIAYRLMSSTVIRAGFGQSADPNNWRYFRNAFPSVVLVTNTAPVNTNFVPAASLTGTNGTGLAGGAITPLPNGIALPTLPDLSSGTVPLPQNVGTTTIVNPFHRGYINSFNLMVQHDWKGTVIETGYVGARGIRPLVFMNANATLPGQPSSTGVLSVALTQAGVCSPCNYSGNPGVGVPFKNNWYDSLQTKVTRRFGGGSTAGFVWTWSKATSYADNEDLGFLTFAHPSLWEKNRSVANFDRTHNVEMYAVLQSPVGKGQHWSLNSIGNAILGGWQFNPIVSKMTGLPFTVTGPNGTTADLVGKYRIVDGKAPQAHGVRGTISQGTQCQPSNLNCHFFDPTAFAVAAAGTFGNTHRNEFRGPGYFQMNLSVHRGFNVTERVALDFRADIINLTNTAHFANPNAGCASQTNAPGSSCSGGLFGAVTGQFQPGGFFGPEPGNRMTWFGVKASF